MKVLLLLLAIATSSSAQTNFFPLLKVGEKAYTNATIRSVTAADAIVTFDGGGAKIALSNLPPDLQKRFGYDPDKASKALAVAAEIRKRQYGASQQAIADLQAKDAWRGEPNLATVISIDGQIAGAAKCTASINNSTVAVLIQGMPAKVQQFFSEKASVENEIASLTAFNERERQRLSNLEDQLPSEAPFDSPAGRAIKQMNIDNKRLAASQERAKALQSQLDKLLESREKFTCFRVRQTAKSYTGLQVWEAF